MIQFFQKHKKTRGVITVFLTLIYLTTYMFIGIFVDGGRVKIAQTAMEDVQQISTENIMSQYNRGLYEYYGLLGVSDYSVEDISKEVQAQIEESIGLKIPRDGIKEFIFNVTNTDTNKELFDPYGVSVNNVKTTYIDLTNEDVLRAQIRDEMRYTAPLVLGANFFSAINEFMSVGSASQAISNVAQTMKSVEEEVGNKKQEYFEKIGEFSNTFKEFVKKTYKLNGDSLVWGFIEISNDIFKAGTSVIDWLNTVIEKVKNIPFIGETLVRTLSFGFDSITKPIRDLKKVVYTDLKIKVGNALDIVENNLVYKIVSQNKDKLKEYANLFNNDPGWPKGEELDIEYVHTINGVKERKYYGAISEQDHRSRAESVAPSIKQKYDAAIKGIIDDCDSVINKLNETQNSLREYKNLIDNIEGRLLNFYNSTNDEKSKTVYETHMADYLKLWDSLCVQDNQLDLVRQNLENTKKTLEGYEQESSYACNNISNENFRLGWDGPEINELGNLRKDNIDGFTEEMKKLATSNSELGGIVLLQKVADGEGEKNNIFETINTLVNLKNSNNGDELNEVDNKNALFGKIKRRSDTTNIIYDPFNDPNLKDDKIEEDEILGKELDDKNIPEEIAKIMNVANNIVNSALESLAGNIYDETYILSHCRDYVHTYRYSKLLKEGKINENTKNLDNILNPKFIKDQSLIHYLDNEQFNAIQVTPAEIEYILFGNANKKNDRGEYEPADTMECVIKMYASIFIIRLALNYIAATISPRSASQCETISASTAMFYPVVRLATPLIYAIPQSIYETKLIMYDCKKANIWNGSADLDLWDPYIEILNHIVPEASNNLAEDLRKGKRQICENTKNAIENIKKDPTKYITIESIRRKNPTANIHAVIEHLIKKDIFDTLMKPYQAEDVDNNKTTSSVSANEDDDNKLKAGYSDYLLLYLFLNGIDKKSQIIKLQSVIETNMSHNNAQPDFKLKNTFAQIGVEADSSIKFIFMNTSFMRNMFTSTSNFKNSRYIIKTKTSYAY